MTYVTLTTRVPGPYACGMNADLQSTPLPMLLDEFAAIVGVEDALAIARAKGGQRVYFPPFPSPEHWLVAAIGQEKANALCRALTTSKGAEVEIPAGSTSAYFAARLRRHLIVRESYAAGKSGNEIARLAGISRRSVQRQISNIRWAEERAARKEKAL